jgi:hypothetical protein
LQGAKLEGVQLQGADLSSAALWLADVPPDLAKQSPAPLGLTDLDMSPLTPEAKAQFKQDLNAAITDPALLAVVMSRLDEILRDEPPDWDGQSWPDLAGMAVRPSPTELARFHAGLACDDTEGYVASRLAVRATEIEAGHFRDAYAKPFANALLDANCQGGKALTRKTRAGLEAIMSAPE